MDWSELTNWDEYTKLLIGLLALADPFGTIPVLGSLTANFSLNEKKRTVNASVLTFTIALLVTLFLGTYILDLFGITIGAFKIAGGIIFLFYALEMLGLIQIPNSSSDKLASEITNSVGITPIGIPLLAGPGTINTIIIYGSFHESFTHKLLVMGVILTVAVIVYLVFQISITMGQGLATKTTIIMNKVMGLILVAIAVEFILDGIVAHFPQLISAH